MKDITWGEAILASLRDCGGKATNMQIYDCIGNHRKLTDEHLKITYAVPHYRHRVRSVLAVLREQHKIIPVREGVNCLPPEAQ